MYTFSNAKVCTFVCMPVRCGVFMYVGKISTLESVIKVLNELDDKIRMAS